MSWQTVEFQGIVSLNRPLVDQLTRYLEKKESQLAQKIIDSIHLLPGEISSPELSPAGYLRLNDAIDTFGKRVRQVGRNQQKVGSEDWKKAQQRIESALWDYADVLQGSVTELFQQAGMIGFEQWTKELKQVVISIKETLTQRVEDLIWGIRRLETLLQEYRTICEATQGGSPLWRKLLFWETLLSRSLVTNLKKSRKLLKDRYKQFADRYDAYQAFKGKIEQSLQKFDDYQVFKTLDLDSQKQFKEIYRFLKLWRKNTSAKVLPERETVRALRAVSSVPNAYALFKEYCQALQEALFARSRIFKRNPDEIFEDELSKSLVKEVVDGHCAELRSLGVTVAKYREFLLRSDPDPYVRSRLGFSESVVGPEPGQTRLLRDLEYEIEKLDEMFHNLGESLEKGPQRMEKIKRVQLDKEIQDTLHEMSQPLISRTVMRSRAETLLESLEEIDELGSFDPSVVDTVEKILSKAMRADWQYHVLQSLPLFHQIYNIHQGIMGPIDDRNHFNRYHLLKRLIDQVEKWVTSCDTQRHAHEIEMDVNDMKVALQEFLAEVQRLSKDESLDRPKRKARAKLYARQLLEYRYLFGSFFTRLPQDESEGKLIRNQFLFVDQYFESVENLLENF